MIKQYKCNVRFILPTTAVSSPYF